MCVYTWVHVHTYIYIYIYIDISYIYIYIDIYLSLYICICIYIYIYTYTYTYTHSCFLFVLSLFFINLNIDSYRTSLGNFFSPRPDVASCTDSPFRTPLAAERAIFGIAGPPGCRILKWSLLCPNKSRHKSDQLQEMDSLRVSSVKIGTIQRRLTWPLRKDDTHKSRSANKPQC